MKFSVHLITLFLFSLTSGLPSNRRHTRAIGGDSAAAGQFPFVVSIGLKSNGHKCGGSIIGEKSVITAAQCVFGYSVDELTVLAGTNLLDTEGIFYNVSGIRVHPDYTNHTYYFNDIAVVTIDGTFEFNDLVNKISIWSFGYLENYQLLTLIGWGDTRTNFNQYREYSNYLQYTKVLHITDEVCDKMEDFVFPRNPGQFCASSFNGVGACKGDLGGPLVNQHGYLAGIVSYGFRARTIGTPYVYTAVQYYKSWISIATTTTATTTVYSRH